MNIFNWFVWSVSTSSILCVTVNNNRVDIINANKSRLLTAWAIHWFDDAIYSSFSLRFEDRILSCTGAMFPVFNTLCSALIEHIFSSLSVGVLIQMLTQQNE